MATYLVRRFLLMILTLFLMSILIFVMLRIVPGNIADILFDSAGFVDPIQKKKLEKEFGLDQPMLTQYLTWIGGLARGDLGFAYVTEKPAIDEILPRIPITEFNSWFRNYSTFATVPQPGSTSLLDPIREVLLNQLTYRNFGTHESIAGTFATNQNAARTGTVVDSGVRWFEMRRVGAGNWTLHQEGTFSPGDANTHHLLGRGVQEADQLGSRRLEDAEQLRAKLGQAGHGRKRLDAIGVEHLRARHEAALDHDLRMVLGKVDDDLRQGDRVRIAVRDGGGLDELVLERGEGRALERSHGQGVLDDLVVAARLADLAPELGDRGHGDAAEVDEDRVLRLREVAAKRLDERFFFLPLECH